MIHIVAGLLVLSLVSAQDLSCADSRLVDSDYIQMYCDADVVFRGSPVTAMSSVGLDTEGRQVEGSVHKFSILQWYQGSLPPTQTISVSRTWRSDDPCDSAPFPDPTGEGVFLVFASRGSSRYSVETCRHSFPWRCLPVSFTSRLPIVC